MRIHASLTPAVCVDNILETNVDLVKACDKKAKDVASGLIDALKTRLEDGGPGKMSLMQLLHAMELADPTTTREITQATWRVVKEIAVRYDIEFEQLRAEILAARKIQRCHSHSAPSCSRATRMRHGSIGKQYSYTFIHDTINFTTVIAS
jgi:hypothetical protein